MKYSMPIASVNVGQKVNLKDFGFDEPAIVFKAYRGRPLVQDTLPFQYDLSNLDPGEERAAFSDEELADEDIDDMTLVVARKSGDRGIVLYISDTQREVEVVDDEPWDI